MSEQSVVQGQTPVSSADQTAVEPAQFRASFLRLLPQLQGMTKEQYPQAVNVDAQAVVSALLGKPMVRIKSFRPTIVAELPKYDIERFDTFEIVVMAFSHANTRNTAAYGTAPHLQKAYQAVLERSPVLQAEAETAVVRKLLPAEPLKELRHNLGFRNTAANLLTIVQVFRTHWDHVKGKTGVTEAELDAAERDAEALTRAIGGRDELPEAIMEAADTQQRVFNLLLQTYDHVERALTYLLWDQRNVQAVLPPLYTGKGPGKRKIGEPKPAEKPAVNQEVPAVDQHVAPLSSGLPSGLPGGDPLEDAE